MAADTFASDIAENPALHLGAMLALAHEAGRDNGENGKPGTVHETVERLLNRY